MCPPDEHGISETDFKAGNTHFPESMRDFTRPVRLYESWIYRQAWEEAQDEQKPG